MTPNRIRPISCFLIAGVGAALSSAQSYGSFTSANAIFGVDVVHNGLDYTVSMDPGAYLMISNTRYDISDVFGFWALCADSPLNATGADQSGWSWNAKSGNGYIAGWADNDKKHDIVAGGQRTFTYEALDQSNVQDYGFHFTVSSPGGGTTTAYYKGPLSPVPEPASLACLGVGILALARRARRSTRPK